MNVLHEKSQAHRTMGEGSGGDLVEITYVY